MFVTLLFLNIFTSTAGCSLEEFPSPVHKCWHGNVEIPFGNGIVDVSNGTKCLTDSGDVQTTILCQEKGGWSVTDTHVKQHSVTLYKRDKRFFGVLLCIVTFFSCLWSGRSGPSRDTEPPHMTCPTVRGLAKPIQTYGIVHWEEPVADDNRDGKITPRRFGRGPGSKFSEGVTRITYEAKDRRGNSKKCNVDVKLEVVRCKAPTPLKDGYVMCHPSTDFVYGGYCWFGCYDGFELTGPSRITCNEHGQWSSAQPICQPWKCPLLDRPAGAELTCTNDNYFRSICTYTCKTGFDMPPQVSKTVVCSIHKTWRSYGQPQCVDVEPPQFVMCPSTIISGTETGSNISLVTWTLPIAADNSKETIIPTQIKGPQLKSKLPAGTYDIVYSAKDSTGNYARECSFNVVVRDVRCPQLYATPYMHLNCPHGYRTGSLCYISCEPGKVLDGKEIVQCNKNPKGLYGEWNWQGGMQAFCKRTNKCTKLSPPKNGAVVCDNWMGGSMCQFQCRKGTDMANINWRNVHTCTKSGDWLPIPIVKPCNAIRGPAQSVGVHASFYFDGDCSNDETKEQIASNFINSIKNSAFAEEACPDSGKCAPQNVQISCGASDKKRRNIRAEKLRTAVTLKAELPLDLMMENSSFEDTYSSVVDIYTRFEEFVKMNANEIFSANVTLLSLENTGLKIICPDGAVRSEQSLTCVDCPEGTYFRKSTSTCELCGKGTYQNSTGQSFCVRCPVRTTTRGLGSASIEMCEDSCEPGTFSSSGLYPCSPCENGQYQQSYGQTSCKECQGTSTTLTVGAKSISDCKEFDIVLPHGQSKVFTTSLDTPQLLPYFTLSVWLQSLGVNETGSLSFMFSDNESHSQWSFTLRTSWSQTNGTLGKEKESAFELTLPDTRWHNIIVSEQGSSTLIYLDKLLVETRPFVMTRQSSPVYQLIINADKSFSGRLSQLHVWSKRDIDSISARCMFDLHGDIMSWNQFGNSVVDGAFIQTPSVCDDFDNCISSPCKYGKCVDDLGGYSCICNLGYEGLQCDRNIDDCGDHVCMEGATCVDGIGNYTCMCPPNVTGLYCDFQIVHGGWSEWNNWTECSETCGEGKQNRRRLCNNPYPDNYGNNCVGLAEDFKACNLTVCPSCPALNAPANGSIVCVTENETQTCNISCNEGFDFDIEPLNSYFCGPHTFHIWNFETKDNPTRKLPKCTEITVAENLRMFYSATYRDLFCESEDTAVSIGERVNKTLANIVKATACFVDKHCVVEDIQIYGCKSNQRERNGRATKNIGFSLSIFVKSDEGKFDEDELQNAIIMINNAAERGDFDIRLLEELYVLDFNLTSVSGDVSCPKGMTRVRHYCVPCGAGSYLSDGYCKPCPYGSYQDTSSQNTCKPCPESRSTEGEGSTSISECSITVLQTSKEAVKGITIAVGISVPLFIVIALLLIYRRMKSAIHGKVEPTITNMFSMSHFRKDPLGAANRRFKTTPSTPKIE